MRPHFFRLPTIVALALSFVIAACMPGQAQQPPFGRTDDINFALALWSSMQAAKLVGPDAFMPKPYEGAEPHGAILTNVDGKLEVNGRESIVIVKTNYMGDGVSIGAVSEDPAKWLDSFTVMFKREAGYDAEDGDWFWAKYNPDGTVQNNPGGVALAGRVAKGAPAGCIACHTEAEGGDFVYTHDRFAAP